MVDKNNELGNVCGTCWHCAKNPYDRNWLCLYSWSNGKEVDYMDTCDLYKPRNKCRHCTYRNEKPTKEPCASCIYVGCGYKPINE